MEAEDSSDAAQAKYLARREAGAIRRLVINWALIEQRRIAAGMTHAQLAARAGPGAVTGQPTRDLGARRPPVTSRRRWET